MLRGYLAVVAQARGTAVGSLTEVRQHDVVVLAQLLDLEDEDLDARFVRLLGMSPEMAADTRRRIAMHRAVLGAAGLTATLFIAGGGAKPVNGTVASGAVAAVSAAAVVVAHPVGVPARAAVPADSPTPPPPSTPATAPVSVEPGATSDTTDTPASTSPPTSEPEIGSALVIERGTQPDDPNVQIGDAESYER
jgi:hypothetical protein